MTNEEYISVSQLIIKLPSESRNYTLSDVVTGAENLLAEIKEKQASKMFFVNS